MNGLLVILRHNDDGSLERVRMSDLHIGDIANFGDKGLYKVVSEPVVITNENFDLTWSVETERLERVR